jgi:hypothetical protein
MSRTIQIAQWSVGHKHSFLSHAALKVTCDKAMKWEFATKGINLELGVPYVFESTTMNEWADKEGVQINKYSDWLENYKGHVYSRAVQAPDTCATGLSLVMARLHGVPYESGYSGFRELAKCIMPMWITRENTINLHCTEMVAEILQELVIMRQFPTNRMPPCIWWKEIDKLMLAEIQDPVQLK